MALAALLGVFLLVAVCGPLGTASDCCADESPAAAGAEATLRLGAILEEGPTDWLDCDDPTVREVWALTHEPLVRCSAEECLPVPGYAESWDATQQAAVWTFRIRPDMSWPDGEAADADDVVFSYDLATEHGAPILSGSTAGIERVEAVDDLTVRIVCSRPRADLTTLRIPIMPEHLWRDVDVDAVRGADPRPALLAGTGPFECAEWKAGEFVRLTPARRSSPPRPQVDEVLILRIAEGAEIVDGLLTGVLDAGYGFAADETGGLGGRKALELVKFPTTAWGYLAFNCRDGESDTRRVLADPSFRTALAWAIDKETVARIGWSNRAQPAITAITNTGYGAAVRWTPADDETIGFDLETAARLLDEAGYTDTDDDGIRELEGRPITLRLTSSDARSGREAGKLLAFWFSEIGVEIEREVIDADDLERRLARKTDGAPDPDFDLLVADAVGADDPGETLDRLGGAAGLSGWVDEEYERLAAAQQRETDPEARAGMLRRMQEILYTRNPQTALAYPVKAESFNLARWHGWVRTPAPEGPAFYDGYSVESFVSLQRATGSPSAVVEGRDTTTIVLIVVGAVVAAAAAGFILYRRSRRGRGASQSSTASGDARVEGSEPTDAR